jgi:tRNA (guanine37-N1)-methyltransferase
LKISVLSLFPEFFESPLRTSLLGRAIDRDLLRIEIVDIRDFAERPHGRCDDYPYGGGSGMVMMPGPISGAVESVMGPDTYVLAMTPTGTRLDNELVKKIAEKTDLCLICGHYEGIDQRVIDIYVDEEISIGDYVLSGGEPAALVLIDSLARRLPGYMSNAESLSEESFEDYLLEYPHYTRPADFKGKAVPEVLLSGNHGAIREWRLNRRLEITRGKRPDIYGTYLKNKELGE